jgi:hypothetical protein
MVKRGAEAIGLPATICWHTLRATGLTAFRANEGRIVHTQEITNHAGPRTTRLSDRTGDQIFLDESSGSPSKHWARVILDFGRRRAGGQGCHAQ